MSHQSPDPTSSKAAEEDGRRITIIGTRKYCNHVDSRGYECTNVIAFDSINRLCEIHASLTCRR